MVLNKVKEINRLANEGVRKKFLQAKTDPRHVALVVVEVLLITLLIVALFFLFDPVLSFPEAQGIPWLVKLFVFVLTIGLVVKVYSYTKEFRKK